MNTSACFLWGLKASEIPQIKQDQKNTFEERKKASEMNMKSLCNWTTERSATTIGWQGRRIEEKMAKILATDYFRRGCCRWTRLIRSTPSQRYIIHLYINCNYVFINYYAKGSNDLLADEVSNLFFRRRHLSSSLLLSSSCFLFRVDRAWIERRFCRCLIFL